MKISYQVEDTRISFPRTIILTLIYFFYLYSFQIPGLSIGTVLPLLALFAIYTLYAFFKGKVWYLIKTRTTRMVKSYWYWNIFLIIYVFCLLQFWGKGDGTSPLNEYIQMLIILPLFYISGNAIFRDLEELMRVLYAGLFIQSIIIIAALIIPALSLALFLLIPEGGYNSDHFGGIDMITKYGYHIGLGVFTSAGSLKMAIGQIGACYFLIKSKGNKLFFHLIIFLLAAIATSVVSRTGLLISFAGLFTVYIAKKNQGGRRALGLILYIFFILLGGYFFVINVLPSDFVEESFKRIIDTANEGVKDTYFTGYTGEGGGDNVIPPICFETVVGLGITTGVSGSGITTITDGGFMRNYSAMGLMVVFINYLIIAKIFIKHYRFSRLTSSKYLIFFMSLVLLFGEFKEYYVYYIYPLCFIFLIFSLIEKENILCDFYNKNNSKKNAANENNYSRRLLSHK